ncbi:MAG: hypothetical protein E7161_02090 [Firmicutes bacterium]|nr:hypothetical protein [Bacillota bacterium]
MKEKDNDKITSIVKLGLWLTFIAVLIIVANFGTNKNNTNDNVLNNSNEQKESVLTYEEKLNKLTDNYKFNYEINADGQVYNYVGTRLSTRESGYRLNNDTYLYYYIEDGAIHEVKDETLYRLETLYEKLDVDNLDVSKIKSSIKNKEFNEENGKYSYLLENNKKVSVYTDSENITKIEIYIGKDYYKLEFTDIGLVEKIKY